MYLYLNRDCIIIDIVEDIKPVRKNVNGIIIPCCINESQGFIGSAEKIYAKVGFNFISSFDDILTYACVEEVPDYVVPRLYKYIDCEFIEAEEYELSGVQLTTESNRHRADIDYIMIMEDL